MNDYMLEVCVDSVESAIAATKAKAKRLELCGNLVIGGTSPSKCLYEEIRKYSEVPIHVLIRPRFGDFCYTDMEFEIIKNEIKLFRELGAQGVVIGILKPNGELDVTRMEQLMEEAGGMNVTLHRAFDMCRNPFQALDRAIELGMTSILTSGQQNTCLEGAKLLSELVEQSKRKINILIGSGVNAEMIPKMYEITKSTQYHMSGKVVLDSEMIYRKKDVAMGTASLDEYAIWRTKCEEIEKAVEVLEHLSVIEQGS